MRDDWEIKKLSDVAEFLNNKRVPIKSLDRKKKQGIFPYYGASGIVDYINEYIFDGTFLLISEDGENLRSRKTPVAFKASGRFWVNNHAHILAEKEHGILDFLEYYFSILDLTPYITGAVQPKLNKANADKIEIPIPEKKERLKINNLLNSFTNKIALNTKTNETLEKLAQALFKSWFVDFDPVKAKVKAKLEGGDLDAVAEELGLSRAVLDLFPDEFEESELGLIPKGWEVSSFGDVSQCFDSKRIPLSKKKREEKKPGNIPYYGATSIMDHINEWIFNDTYLLLGEDGSVAKDNGIPFSQYIWGKAWVNNHAHVLKGKNGISTEQLMLFIKNTNINAYITGAVQLKLNQGNMNSIPFLKATSDINENFDKFIQPFFEKTKKIIEQNQSLTQFRDTLLPKLLSNEITIESE